MKLADVKKKKYRWLNLCMIHQIEIMRWNIFPSETENSAAPSLCTHQQWNRQFFETKLVDIKGGNIEWVSTTVPGGQLVLLLPRPRPGHSRELVDGTHAVDGGVELLQLLTDVVELLRVGCQVTGIRLTSFAASLFTWCLGEFFFFGYITLYRRDLRFSEGTSLRWCHNIFFCPAFCGYNVAVVVVEG